MNEIAKMMIQMGKETSFSVINDVMGVIFWVNA